MCACLCVGYAYLSFIRLFVYVMCVTVLAVLFVSVSSVFWDFVFLCACFASVGYVHFVCLCLCVG